MLSAIIAKSAVVLNELVTAIDCISGKEFIRVCVCVCVCACEVFVWKMIFLVPRKEMQTPTVYYNYT